MSSIVKDSLQANNTNNIPVIEPIASIRQVNFHILKNNEVDQCQFWLALSRIGPMETAELMDKEDIKSIFHLAYNIGINETIPSLIINTQLKHDRLIYLLPIQEHTEFRPQAIWMADIAQAIKSLQVKKIGFYLPPQVFADESQPNIFESVMRHLVISTEVNDFYLLTGDHGSNFMINAALFLKEDLLEEKPIKITIFH